MSSYRIPPTPMYLIKRGPHYLTLDPLGWTRFRPAAAVFQTAAVAQSFLKDLKDAGTGAEVIPYVEEGRVTL